MRRCERSSMLGQQGDEAGQVVSHATLRPRRGGAGRTASGAEQALVRVEVAAACGEREG